MNQVYCPSCRASIPGDALYCPECGSAVSTRLRLEEESVRLADEAVERAALAAREAEDRRILLEVEATRKAAKAEAERVALYNRSTGRGVCPSCKSPNVRETSTKEGSNLAGANMACCLGCVLSPLAFLALPFMGGRKVKLLECQYCSNRWRL